MKVYVDNMLVKSKIASDHVTHLAYSFNILRTYRMKLNLLKCAFGVASGKYAVSEHDKEGVESNQEGSSSQPVHLQGHR